jgi:hypothetical protein
MNDVSRSKRCNRISDTNLPDTVNPAAAGFPSFALVKNKQIPSMKLVKLGSQGLVVPSVGLGCMGMTGIAHMDIYGKSDEAEAIATIHRSLELGGNFLDTAYVKKAAER